MQHLFVWIAKCFFLRPMVIAILQWFDVLFPGRWCNQSMFSLFSRLKSIWTNYIFIIKQLLGNALCTATRAWSKTCSSPCLVSQWQFQLSQPPLTISPKAFRGGQSKPGCLLEHSESNTSILFGEFPEPKILNIATKISCCKSHPGSQDVSRRNLFQLLRSFLFSREEVKRECSETLFRDFLAFYP